VSNSSSCWFCDAAGGALALRTLRAVPDHTHSKNANDPTWRKVIMKAKTKAKKKATYVMCMHLGGRGTPRRERTTG